MPVGMPEGLPAGPGGLRAAALPGLPELRGTKPRGAHRLPAPAASGPPHACVERQRARLVGSQTPVEMAPSAHPAPWPNRENGLAGGTAIPCPARVALHRRRTSEGPLRMQRAMGGPDIPS